MNLRLLPIFFLALTTLACSTQTRTFDVAVKNETSQPIIVWLTKDGPPEEAGWESPEQLASISPVEESPLAGQIVPPGKTATTGKRTGHFAGGTSAWLRVYIGTPTFAEILATSRGSVSRRDILLNIGTNNIVVSDRTGKITAAMVDALPPTGKSTTQP